MFCCGFFVLIAEIGPGANSQLFQRGTFPDALWVAGRECRNSLIHQKRAKEGGGDEANEGSWAALRVNQRGPLALFFLACTV